LDIKVEEKVKVERITKPLFKHFLVTGVEHNSLANAPSNEKFYQKAKILYEYSGEKSLAKERRDIVEMFSFPFNAKVERIKMTKSFSNINEIIF
jgi:hypothetical protein